MFRVHQINYPRWEIPRTRLVTHVLFSMDPIRRKQAGEISIWVPNWFLLSRTQLTKESLIFLLIAPLLCVIPLSGTEVWRSKFSLCLVFFLSTFCYSVPISNSGSVPIISNASLGVCSRGEALASSFKDGTSTLIEIMNFFTECLRHDEKLLAPQCRGYRLFLSWTLGVWQLVFLRAIDNILLMLHQTCLPFPSLIYDSFHFLCILLLVVVELWRASTRPGVRQFHDRQILVWASKRSWR